MEKLVKIIILMGMGMGIILFSLVVASFIPQFIRNNDWDEIFPTKSTEEIREMLMQTDSYKAFILKYPEHGEYFHDDRRLELKAMNFNTYNLLELRLDYDKRYDNIQQYVECDNQVLDQRFRLDGPLVTKFIEEIDCLSGHGIVAAPSPLVNDYGEPVVIDEWALATGDFN